MLRFRNGTIINIETKPFYIKNIILRYPVLLIKTEDTRKSWLSLKCCCWLQWSRKLRGNLHDNKQVFHLMQFLMKSSNTHPFPFYKIDYFNTDISQELQYMLQTSWNKRKKIRFIKFVLTQLFQVKLNDIKYKIFLQPQITRNI